MEDINTDCLNIKNLSIFAPLKPSVCRHWTLMSSCPRLVFLHHYFLDVCNVLDLIRCLYFVNKQLHGLRFALSLEVMVQNVCDLKR
jgi:hypothetical protein